MKRREFVVILGSALAWPLAAGAQAPRLVAVLMNRAAENGDGRQEVAAFRQALEHLGWSEGRTIRIEVRWGADDLDLEHQYAVELMALDPDTVLAGGTESVSAVQHLSRTVPIVFAGVTDPLGAGFVDSLSHPGTNATGFMLFEYSLGGKVVELLKEVAPELRRVAVVRDPANPSNLGQFGAIQAAAQPLGIEVSAINLGDAQATERSFAAFASSPKGGLIVLAGASARQPGVVVALAARYKLPAIYTSIFELRAGGLICYTPDRIDQFRRAGGYVDRILKGEKPGDLPVQAPAKYELAINLKTAKSLGLSIPPSLLARADEVIE
jgi:putative ABC transport system substrate-binding protein